MNIGWKPIPDFDNYYVSENGDIKLVKNNKERIIKPIDNGNGYLYVTLYRNKTASKNKYIHRLVAALFVSNPNNYKVVNHKDCNKKNNIYSNLEWGTSKHNSLHASENGLFKTGFEHPTAKVLLNMQTGIFYPNIFEAAKSLDIKWQRLYGWLNYKKTNRSSFMYV